VGWSTFFIPFLFVARAEPADGSPLWLSAWNLARNLLGIFVGTAAVVGYAFCPLRAAQRLLFGAAALAILIPQNAFPGAEVLDWLGLVGASALIVFEFARARRIMLRNAFATCSSLSRRLPRPRLYPAKPVKIIVPWPPAGVSDILAVRWRRRSPRRAASSSSSRTSPGAGGTLGMAQLAKSPPDGYTLAPPTSRAMPSARRSMPSCRTTCSPTSSRSR